MKMAKSKEIRSKTGSRSAVTLHRKVSAKGAPYSAVVERRFSPLAGLTTNGNVDIMAVAKRYRMTNKQIAETAGLASTAVVKAERREAQKTQTRMREMMEILELVKVWAGGEIQAMAWYRAQPIPALNGRTSEQLVKDGQAAAVRAYIDHMALGGYA